MQDFDSQFANMRQRAHTMVMEAMLEVFNRMPFNQPVEMANGRTAILAPVGVVYEADTELAQGCDELRPHRFTFDLRFTDGKSPDHIEFTVEHTGWGGFTGTASDADLAEAATVAKRHPS